ncbi:NAD(P)-dependent oxidoreductase [Glutamicibacter sp. NPDC087344]|uniref:NAD(P)-dependent oxidoreductase n=1 Tax=Glutamicibacter sp. NPDC087344 TaxID=3363994 RepID=UPI0037F77EBE
MKIIVLGAIGNLGSRFAAQAATAGHEVVAFARRRKAVTVQSGITTAKGSAEVLDTLATAAHGADALLVSITGSMKDTTFMQRTLPHITAAASHTGVSRKILVHVLGAGDTARQASGFARMVYRSVLCKFFDDKAVADQKLPASDLEWTIVYPVNLNDAPAMPERATVKELSHVKSIPGLPARC